MPSPQLENGYTTIANELLEVMAFIQLPPNEWQVLFVIIRKTYGYKKKVDRIANLQIMDATGLGKEVVSRAIKNLTRKGLVSRTGKYLGINKDYGQWQLAELLTKKLAEQSTELAELLTKVSSSVVTQKKKENIQKKENINIYKKNKDNHNGGDPDRYKNQKYGHIVHTGKEDPDKFIKGKYGGEVKNDRPGNYRQSYRIKVLPWLPEVQGSIQHLQPEGNTLPGHMPGVPGGKGKG